MDGDAVAPRWPRLVPPVPFGEEPDAPRAAPTEQGSPVVPIVHQRAVEPYPTFTAAELAQFPDPVPLVAGMLASDSLALLFGRWGAYKTFAALAIAFGVATGRPVFGHAVAQGPVFYAFGEGRAGFKRRIAALCRLHGIDAVDIRFLAEAPQLTVAEQVDRLVATVRAMPRTPVLIVIDTLARHMGGDENTQEDMTAFVRACDRLRSAAAGATILVVHHEGHTAGRGRGSSVLPAAVDTEIACTREKDEPQATLTCTKQRDLEPFAPIVLDFHRIAGTESGVLILAAVADPRTRTDEERVLDVIRRAQPVTKRALRAMVRVGGSISSDRIDAGLARLVTAGLARNDTIDGKTGWCVGTGGAERAGEMPRSLGCGTPSGTVPNGVGEVDAARPGTPAARGGTPAARDAGPVGVEGVPACRGSINPGSGTLAPESENLSLPLRAGCGERDAPAPAGGEELL